MSASSSTAAAAASSDPFFLEFGSSVSVNEDLYREIHNEVRQLEASTQKTHQEIKTESRTQLHLAKDYAHATNEMKMLSRNTAEAVEEAVMNQETRVQLAEQFRTGLVDQIRPENEFDDQNDNMNVDGLDGTKRKAKPQDGEGAQNHQSLLSLSEVVVKATKDLEEAMATSHKLRDSVDAIAAEKREIEEETFVIQQRLGPTSELTNMLGEAKEELEARRLELEAEDQRVESLKEACHQSRTKCTEYATELVDQVRRLAVFKREAQHVPRRCVAILSSYLVSVHCYTLKG
jgi:chromosome segregation ATPase